MLDPLPAAAPVPRPPARIDQRVTLRGVAWRDYEALAAARGERSTPRLTFLDGVLELMSPSIDHEQIKKNIARLVEEWANLLDLDLEGFGSWTVKHAGRSAGAEADECYTLGGPGRPEKPQLAIEVNWTSGGMDKLQVWAALEVGEVWVWEDDQLRAYVLEGSSFVERPASALLPQMDLGVIARLCRMRQSAARKELRAIVGPAR